MQFARRHWILLWLAIVFAAVAPEFWQFAAERRAIAAVAREIAAGPGAGALPDKVQQAVARRIRAVAVGRSYDVSTRPFLRHTAWQIWQWREGTCGDGARLIVVLLDSLGIRAARINLTNDITGFGHTAVAYERRGQWYLLDSIASPPGFHRWSVSDRRPLDRLVRYSSDYEGGGRYFVDNPFFTRFSFVDATRMTRGLVMVQLVQKPGRWLVLLIENPPLLRGLLKLALGFLLLPLALLAPVRAKPSLRGRS